MVDESVVNAVRKYLRAVEESGMPVSFAIIFGSQVTGRADEWSDIDLIVVSPRFDAERTWADMSLLWRIAGRIDSRIEPIPCGERQWREDDASAIIEIARRHGQRVELAEVA